MPDLTDAEKLRVLAEWLDLEDAKVGRIGNEIQQDLRRIASIIESPLHEAAGVMLAALKRLAEVYESAMPTQSPEYRDGLRDAYDSACQAIAAATRAAPSAMTPAPTTERTS